MGKIRETLVVGTVRFFRKDKYYGFVQARGGDGSVHLSLNVLKQSGFDAPNKGDQITGFVRSEPKGRTFYEVHSVAPRKMPLDKGRTLPRRKSVHVSGAIKWFDPKIGYGFICCLEVPTDIFLPRQRVCDAGIPLEEAVAGLTLDVWCRAGDRGLVAERIQRR